MGRQAHSSARCPTCAETCSRSRGALCTFGLTAHRGVHLGFCRYDRTAQRSGAAWAEQGFPDETPAGIGYLTVVVITISAILTAFSVKRLTPEELN